MPEEYIVSKTENSAYNDNKKKYADKFIAFYDGKPGTKRTPDGITYGHWNGNGKYNATAGRKEKDWAKIGGEVNEFCVSACF